MSIALELARTLAVIVDEGSLEAAARRLHVTPSAVSQRVRSLEAQLGRVLLVRTRPARPTDAGAAVVRLARQLDVLEHDLRAAVGQEEEWPALPLAVNADSLATWFLPPLARVAAERRVRFALHRDDQDFTAGLLESGTVMAAVTSRAEPVAGCRVAPLGVLRYEAVAAAGFAARWFPDGVGAEALAAAPVVDFDRRDDLQTRWLALRGVDSDPPRHLVPASADFAHAIRLGLGWGLLPRFQSADGLRSGALVPLGGPPVDVPLYWQQWNLASELLDLVAAEVLAAARAELAPLSRR
ncbi:LysR family transcriptional regulator ArgP [Microbacterium sp. 10M-3C3]|jgi:LysR family transcriptional regulator (chromosome initiation inhibitor)|uniref:LysR family transcriptional regulator ArgP n=1 Tax=Microbacterium sp. 10M-3C3 TaxID=2483401 RepID=UPI000F63E3B3|nr:LysR family transcriptional regulator ArgP [Microbacterium sp. 10M-3C3]